MAAATASQPQISIKIVIVRLIGASSLPCIGHTRFANDSLVAAMFQAIDQRSPVTNPFALSNVNDYRLRLYRCGAASYDQQPSREYGCLASEQESDDGAGIFSNSSCDTGDGLRGRLAGCAGSVAPEVKRLPERVELSGTFYRAKPMKAGPRCWPASCPSRA